MIKTFNECRSELHAAFTPLLERALARPTPHEYGKHSVWATWQEKEDAILCLRPPNKRSLPLHVLHDVFRTYRLQVRQPLPQIEEAAPFLRVAFNLSATMGQAFREEKDRSYAFDSCFGDLRSPFDWSPQHVISAHSELREGGADTALVKNGVWVVIREDKVEVGDGHDAYMQACRAYQIHTASDKAKALAGHGLPVFLLTVQGMHVAGFVLRARN